MHDILNKLLLQQRGLRLAAFTALLISHLTWNYSEGKYGFTTRDIVKRLISLADFNELINEGDAEATVDSL
jgi:hypothetical protein